MQKGKIMGTDDKLKIAVEHIEYEHDMLVFTAAMLVKASEDPDQSLTNVLLESFSTHAANLYEFLYRDTKKHPDDISVYDYQIEISDYKKNRSPEGILREIPGKRNKQIAHLTFARNNYDDETKKWNFGEICRLLNNSYNAFTSSLSESQKEWFKKS